jgi:hypothetical protein
MRIFLKRDPKTMKCRAEWRFESAMMRDGGLKPPVRDMAARRQPLQSCNLPCQVAKCWQIEFKLPARREFAQTIFLKL